MQININLLFLIIPLLLILNFREQAKKNTVNRFVALLIFKISAAIYFELEFHLISDMYENFTNDNLILLGVTTGATIIFIFSKKLKLKLTELLVMIAVTITLLSISGMELEFLSEYVKGFYFIITMVGTLGLKESKNKK